MVEGQRYDVRGSNDRVRLNADRRVQVGHLEVKYVDVGNDVFCRHFVAVVKCYLSRLTGQRREKSEKSFAQECTLDLVLFQ